LTKDLTLSIEFKEIRTVFMKKTSSIYNNTFILQSNLTKVKRGFNLKEIKMRKAAFHNLGCKVNSYETESMQQLLEDAGYEIVPFREGADVYIINTCSVTNVADRKSRQMLHRAKKMNPSAAVVAVGCYVQAAGAELKKDEAVDLIVGNNQKKDLVQILDDYFADHENSGEILDIGHSQEYEELHIRRIADHTRAFIKVQDGCNQFCSYCIIPYTRGRVRSRRPEDIEREVRGIAEAGYKEIVLTGIHLSSYGVDFKDEQKENLLTLIKRLDQIPGIERLRLGSLEPRIVTREFAKELARLRTICPHFHLSLQSGCDATLKRMNRRYTPGEYENCVSRLRAAMPGCAITTDVIAGFPGESGATLRRLNHLKELLFCSGFLFRECHHNLILFRG
jgi:threonylcarbamoyladenosine tRNA methylthiotransferase MtaB